MSARVVSISGPTACGKTALGILLAKGMNGEVVSVDSMQIYRGMTIGTAAPAPEEMDGVPHHMIGIADPREMWSAARYVQTAVPLVDDILARGKLPILVGGTGLWMDALIRGRAFPPGSAGGSVRLRLEQRLATEGIDPLLEELRRVDPDTAARLHPADHKRILRALEVYQETGRTITDHNHQDRQLPPRYEAVKIGLRFSHREDMWRFIDRRVERMFQQGLLDEVRSLLNMGVPKDATALQAIGYKEVLAVVEDGRLSWEEAMAAVKQHSRQYAKRQLTWLRRDLSVHWIEWDREPDMDRALKISTDILSASGICRA